jgi:hypothetical protein
MHCEQFDNNYLLQNQILIFVVDVSFRTLRTICSIFHLALTARGGRYFVLASHLRKFVVQLNTFCNVNDTMGTTGFS